MICKLWDQQKEAVPQLKWWVLLDISTQKSGTEIPTWEELKIRISLAKSKCAVECHLKMSVFWQCMRLKLCGNKLALWAASTRAKAQNVFVKDDSAKLSREKCFLAQSLLMWKHLLLAYWSLLKLTSLFWSQIKLLQVAQAGKSGHQN
jgi:hypothetical protein